MYHQLLLIRDGDDENRLYRLTEDGQEELISSYPGTGRWWCSVRERFYYLSNSELNEYDPISGDITSHTLSTEYDKISGVGDGFVLLQQSIYGPVFKVSTDSYSEEELDADGWILAVDGDCLLAWDTTTYELSLYNCATNKEVWHTNLSDTFGGAPTVRGSGDRIYAAYSFGSGVYSSPRQSADFEAVETAAGRILAMTDAGEYVICAVNGRDATSFFALYPDGTFTKFATWTGTNYYQDGSVRMAAHNGKLYCTITSEDALFSCALP